MVCTIAFAGDGIWQVCCPEFNVGMTFIGLMNEDEVRAAGC